MCAKIFQSSTVLHLIQNQESANDDKNAAVLIAINTKHVADRCCWLLSGARPSLSLSKQNKGRNLKTLFNRQCPLQIKIMGGSCSLNK